MPICQNCGKEWTWKQTIKTLFKLKCPHCDKKQYEAASSRIKSGIYITIPSFILVFLINMFLDFSIGMGIISAIIFALILFGSYPFLLKLSNEEEPFW